MNTTQLYVAGSANTFGPRRKAALLGLAFVAALMVVAVLAMASPARADTFTVTSNADSGAGTLRTAVNEAMLDTVPDTITFDLPSNQHTITLASEIAFGKMKTTIDGGISGVTISGNGATRVFYVYSGAQLDLRSLTVANGLATNGNGGGIYNDHGTLDVSDSTFSNNGASGSGGGIFSYTTLSGPDKTTIENSTVSGNSAKYGGGVYNHGGLTTIRSTTITRNAAGYGAGVASTGDTNTTSTVVGSSIIAANPTSDVAYVNGSEKGSVNSFVSEGYNVIGKGNASDPVIGSTTSVFNKTDLVGVSDPRLGPLADNGGPTQTHALLIGSPAIDGGNTTLTTDQRGQRRPFDDPNIAPRPNGNNSDVGSFEAQKVVLNTPPQANDDAYSTDEDTSLTVDPKGVLANDTDAESNTLTATKVKDPAHGALTLNKDGSFTYTPSANYSGPDSFTYKANDGTLNSNEATVNITVNAVNDAPVAEGDTLTTYEDTPTDLAVLANDTDVEANSLSVAGFSQPAHGTVSKNVNGTLTYTPATNYYGPDSFTYNATDGSAYSNEATVNITVNAVNDAPKISILGGSGNQECLSNDSGASITFKLWDVDNNLSDLTLSHSSSNTTLVPDSNITFAGDPTTGTRTATISTVPTASGTSTVTITASDGQATDNASVTVKAGTDADDTLKGTGSADILLGRSGDDTLIGYSGIDALCGSDGNDTLTGGDGKDLFDGGLGTDKATDYNASEDTSINVP